MILLPVLLLSKLAYGSDDCSICFEALPSDEERVHLGCHDTHDVHRGCAKRWFESVRQRSAQATCPTCRAVVDMSIVSDVLEIPMQSLESTPMSGSEPVDDVLFEQLVAQVAEGVLGAMYDATAHRLRRFSQRQQAQQRIHDRILTMEHALSRTPPAPPGVIDPSTNGETSRDAKRSATSGAGAGMEEDQEVDVSTASTSSTLPAEFTSQLPATVERMLERESETDPDIRNDLKYGGLRETLLKIITKQYEEKWSGQMGANVESPEVIAGFLQSIEDPEAFSSFIADARIDMMRTCVSDSDDDEDCKQQ